MHRSGGGWRSLHGALARRSMQGLVSGAGRTVQGGQSVEEGGAREELEKDVAKGSGQPNLAFGPGLLFKRLGDFEEGSGLAEAALLSVLHFLPRPGW